MARNFKELQTQFSPERRARTEERVQKAIAEMALNELRQARKFTQAGLASTLGADPEVVSKLEPRSKSTVREIAAKAASRARA
jgi:hypothetical protein